MLLAVPPDQDFLLSQTGMTWSQLLVSDPRIANYIGLSTVERYGVGASFAILLMVIAVTSYRKAENWAWYAFFVPPLLLIITASVRYLRYGNLGTVPFIIPALLLIFLGLFLPYRKFLAKKQMAAS